MLRAPCPCSAPPKSRPAGQSAGPTWLSLASWGVRGAMWARRASPPPHCCHGQGQAYLPGPCPQAVASGLRTPLPSGPCVFTGPACSQESADAAPGLLCLHAERVPAGARGRGGGGGTWVGRGGGPQRTWDRREGGPEGRITEEGDEGRNQSRARRERRQSRAVRSCGGLLLGKRGLRVQLVPDVPRACWAVPQAIQSRCFPGHPL